MTKSLCVYVDVDDTFVRSHGNKRIPVPSVIEHIKALKEEGAVMYCWSSGGVKYAETSAIEFGVHNCFVGFLPKPEVSIDDMQFEKWRNLLQVHPNECPGNTIESYRAKTLGK